MAMRTSERSTPVDTLRLPPESHQAYAHFERAALGNWYALTPRRDVIRAIRRAAALDVAAGAPPRVRHGLCRTAVDEIELVRVGPRGGQGTVWKFGSPFADERGNAGGRTGEGGAPA